MAWWGRDSTTTGMIIVASGCATGAATGAGRGTVVGHAHRIAAAGTAAGSTAAIDHRLRSYTQTLSFRTRRRYTADPDNAQGATDKSMNGTHGDQAP
jgi:hypothetical protein